MAISNFFGKSPSKRYYGPKLKAPKVRTTTAGKAKKTVILLELPLPVKGNRKAGLV
jgi:hypothetical protein